MHGDGQPLVLHPGARRQLRPGAVGQVAHDLHERGGARVGLDQAAGALDLQAVEAEDGHVGQRGEALAQEVRGPGGDDDDLAEASVELGEDLDDAVGRMDRVGIFLDRCEGAVEIEEEGAVPGSLRGQLEDGRAGACSVRGRHILSVLKISRNVWVAGRTSQAGVAESTTRSSGFCLQRLASVLWLGVFPAIRGPDRAIHVKPRGQAPDPVRASEDASAGGEVPVPGDPVTVRRSPSDSSPAPRSRAAKAQPVGAGSPCRRTTPSRPSRSGAPGRRPSRRSPSPRSRAARSCWTPRCCWPTRARSCASVSTTWSCPWSSSPSWRASGTIPSSATSRGGAAVPGRPAGQARPARPAAAGQRRRRHAVGGAQPRRSDRPAGRVPGTTTTPASSPWRSPSRPRATTSRWSPRTCRCGSRPPRSGLAADEYRHGPATDQSYRAWPSSASPRTR